MLETLNKSCPECDSQEIVITRLQGVASTIGTLDCKSALFAEICINCGKVLNLRAEHPSRLKEEKND